MREIDDEFEVRLVEGSATDEPEERRAIFDVSGKRWLRPVPVRALVRHSPEGASAAATRKVRYWPGEGEATDNVVSRSRRGSSGSSPVT